MCIRDRPDTAAARVTLRMHPNSRVTPACVGTELTLLLHQDPPGSGSWRIAGWLGARPFSLPPLAVPGSVYHDEEPILVKIVSPAGYPELARAKGIQGKVILNALVTVQGTVGDIQVLQGPPELVQVCIDAVKQYLFKPALACGDPVAAWVAIPISFKLSGN